MDADDWLEWADLERKRRKENGPVKTSLKRYRRPGAALRRAARRDGWHPDDRCTCGPLQGKTLTPPSAAVVGGDGYWLPGLMCLNCARRAWGRYVRPARPTPGREG